MEGLRRIVVQIAGSISKSTNFHTILFSHAIVKRITHSLLEDGYIVMTTVGREDSIDNKATDSSSLVFYWDILETAYEFANSYPEKSKNSLIVVSSEKLESQIPLKRKELWKELLDKQIMTIIRIEPGWNAGAYKRQIQEKNSDGLITFGGGEGTEHLIALYSSNGKLALPLDMPLGSSFKDGIGGSPLISRFAISNPDNFVPIPTNETSNDLIKLSYSMWTDDLEGYSESICSFVNKYLKLKVFYVRLMDEKATEFQQVETFFREVVDVVIKSRSLTTIEIDRARLLEPFLNIEIFKEIKHSSYLMVDLTGLRPNCFIELGYSLGLGKTVFLTAMSGTHLPFDTDQIPCFFWDPNITASKTQSLLISFLERNLSRRSI
ncbi:MAG: hypothetical protein ACYCT2_09760 [Thermoplasmataceae archaeon]